MARQDGSLRIARVPLNARPTARRSADFASVLRHAVGVATVEPERDILDSTEAGGLIIRGGAIRAVGYVVSTLIALIGIALVTRHLGVADFGRFQTVMSLILIVGTVTDAGMGSLAMREYAQRVGENRDRLMRSLFGLRLVLTLVGMVIATVIAIAIGYDRDLVIGTVLAGLGLVTVVAQTALSVPLVAELRNMTLTLIDLLRQVLNVGLYVALVVAGAGVTAFLGVWIPVGIVVGVVVAALVRGKIPLLPSFHLGEAGELLRAAIAFSMATAVGVIYLYTAQILTAAVTSADETGLFSASFRVFVVIAGMPALLITVAFPLLSRAARDDHERLAYAVQRLIDTTAILGYAAALGLVVGAPTIIEIMAGPDFAGAVPVLQIQAATLTATFLLAPMGFALLSIHAHREILVVNTIGLVAMVAAVAGLAAASGAQGAAIGTVIGESTLGLSYYLALRLRAPDLVPSLARPLRGLAAVAPCFLILLVPALPAWLAAGIALAAYAVLLLATRTLPEELTELLPRLRR